MSEAGHGRGGRTRGRVAVLAALCVLVGVAGASGQEALTEHTFARSAGAPAPSAAVEDMAWMAGHWMGEALGGTAEEIWSPPRGGAMMGMFRLVKDGETVFYELMTIVPEDGSLVLRLKHFNADLTGWEEKEKTVDFPLVAVADGAFHFDGLSFRPDGEDHLRVHLAMHGKDGTTREETFVYTRVPATGREP
ncbi:MAG: DUF6265 family protein [Acidobacteria bacterium]|jgi:hypothetical protein|nr:DUF6265 family protein [Acidobacteriota bacterium]